MIKLCSKTMPHKTCFLKNFSNTFVPSAIGRAANTSALPATPRSAMPTIAI